MNTRPAAVLVCLLIASPSPARAQTDARSRVERAVQLMGGEALRNLRTLRYDATAVLFAQGQNAGLNEPMAFNTRTSVIRHDYAGTRLAVVSEFPGAGPNGQTFRQRFVQSPAAGMGDNNGNFQPLPAVIPVAIRTFPSYLLLAALDPAARLERSGAGVRMYGALDTLTMFFDDTGRLAYTETVADDPMLGDRVTRTTYRSWTPVGRDGLLLPARVDVSANGTVTQLNNLRGFAPNEALPDSVFAIPDSIAQRSRALAGGAGPVTVRVDSLAPGVYHVTGGSHHSLAVVQSGSTIVFEAPQSTARMRAVLDTLASRFPQAPVRMAINSHDHWDHAGGVRAALAARLTVLAHATSIPQLRETARARRSVAPDGVERMRHDLRAVQDSMVIGTGADMLIVYRLPTSHDDGLLVGYHPASRILFVTDVIPSQNPVPNREVADFVAAHGLAVERVVPSHGAVVPWSRVQQLAGQ